MVDQLVDLFHTTHTVKTQHITKSRGRYCGGVELTTYLSNAAGPVPLVLDLFSHQCDRLRLFPSVSYLFFISYTEVMWHLVAFLVAVKESLELSETAGVVHCYLDNLDYGLFVG